MKTHSRLRACLYLLLLSLCGCATETVQVFRGRAENIVGDGWTEDGTRVAGTIIEMPSNDGGGLLGLSIDPEAAFVLRHPLIKPDKPLNAHSTNDDLRAWLVQNPKIYGGAQRPEDFLSESETNHVTPLTGNLDFHRKNNFDFTLRVDVRGQGTNSAALCGEFETHRRTRFEPAMVLVAPAMMFGFGLAKTPSKPHDARPEKSPQRGPLSSIDKPIQRLMRFRKRSRSFDVKILGTGKYIEFSNQTTLLDKSGIHVQFFSGIETEDRATALKAFCREQGFHLRTFPIEKGGSFAFIDIYGEFTTVAERVKTLLRQGFGAGEGDALEYLPAN